MPAKTRVEKIIEAYVIVIARITDEYLDIGFGRGCRWQGGANGLPVLYELESAAATCKLSATSCLMPTPRWADSHESAVRQLFQFA